MVASIITSYWEFNFRHAQLAVACKNRKYLYIGNLNHRFFFSLLRSTSVIHYLKFNCIDNTSGDEQNSLAENLLNLCLNPLGVFYCENREELGVWWQSKLSRSLLGLIPLVGLTVQEKTHPLSIWRQWSLVWQHLGLQNLRLWTTLVIPKKKILSSVWCCRQLL